MSALHVLMPPLARVDGAPELRRWLARGDRLPDFKRARDDVTRALFRFAGDAVPAAALRHHCHAGDAGAGTWLCADPAYVRSEAAGARLMRCPMDDLAVDEAAEFARALRPTFGDAGVPLEVDTPSAWCVHLAEGASPAKFVHPPEALGTDLLECLPDGAAGRKWRQLFNEAQVALHAHPGNAARTAAGKLPVNALWFWGLGSLPVAVASGLRVVASRDDVLRGLAKMANVVCVEPSQLDAGVAGDRADALLDLDVPADADIGGLWIPRFREWLHRRQFDTVVLAFADGGHYRLRHVHRLRFWRRA